MHQLSSSNSLAHGKQRVCVEDFAEFFAVIDNHKKRLRGTGLFGVLTMAVPVQSGFTE